MAPSGPGIVEVEWQFDAASLDAVSSWLRNAAIPGFSLVPQGVRHLSDTYYDTPGWRLYHSGFTCRVRATGDTWTLTLKQMGDPHEGVRARREIEQPLPPAASEPPLDATGTARDYLHAAAGNQPIRAIFRIETSRQTFALLDHNGQAGEIALDDTAISPDREGGILRLARVEIEVNEHTRERALPFVDALVAGCGLSPARLSKFQAGLEANGLAVTPAAPVFAAVRLTPATPAGAYAIATLQRHFRDLLLNEPATRLGEDPEALHDMRVAARRLWAALRTFQPYLPPEWPRFREDFGWLCRSLGGMQDLDVQLARMAEWTATLPCGEGKSLQPLRNLLIESRAEARGSMLATLDSPRYDALIEEFTSALGDIPGTRYDPGPPIREVAPALVARAQRRVRRLGDAISEASDPGDSQRLLIEASQLRYTVEFVQDLYGRPAREFAAAVQDLQNHLRFQREADQAVAHLHELALGSAARLGPATLFSMGAIAERYRVQAVELRRDFRAAYGSLCGERWTSLRRALAQPRRRRAGPGT